MVPDWSRGCIRGSRGESNRGLGLIKYLTCCTAHPTMRAHNRPRVGRMKRPRESDDDVGGYEPQQRGRGLMGALNGGYAILPQPLTTEPNPSQHTNLTPTSHPPHTSIPHHTHRTSPHHITPPTLHHTTPYHTTPHTHHHTQLSTPYTDYSHTHTHSHTHTRTRTRRSHRGVWVVRPVVNCCGSTGRRGGAAGGGGHAVAGLYITTSVFSST